MENPRMGRWKIGKQKVGKGRKWGNTKSEYEKNVGRNIGKCGRMENENLNMGNGESENREIMEYKIGK